MCSSTRTQWRVGLALVRAGLAFPVWIAAHWTAVACIYGGFYLPEYVPAPRSWLLPLAWSAALYLGIRVAAGGGFPAPAVRALPFAGIAWLMLRDGASVAGSGWYVCWAAVWIGLALLAGYRHATRELLGRHLT